MCLRAVMNPCIFCGSPALQGLDTCYSCESAIVGDNCTADSCTYHGNPLVCPAIKFSMQRPHAVPGDHSQYCHHFIENRCDVIAKCPRCLHQWHTRREGKSLQCNNCGRITYDINGDKTFDDWP